MMIIVYNLLLYDIDRFDLYTITKPIQDNIHLYFRYKITRSIDFG